MLHSDIKGASDDDVIFTIPTNYEGPFIKRDYVESKDAKDSKLSLGETEEIIHRDYEGPWLEKELDEKFDFKDGQFEPKESDAQKN